MRYLVAYPDSLRTFATKAEAEAAADEWREEQPVKIYEVREVAHLYPRKPKLPKLPPRTPA